MCTVTAGQRPSLADYVRGTGTPRGQPLPQGRSVDYALRSILLAPEYTPFSENSPAPGYEFATSPG
jgi:hypothetical protein